MLGTKDIEATVGRLYLTILDLQQQIEELKAQLPEPKPAPAPGIFSIAQARPASEG